MSDWVIFKSGPFVLERKGSSKLGFCGDTNSALWR